MAETIFADRLDVWDPVIKGKTTSQGSSHTTTSTTPERTVTSSTSMEVTPEVQQKADNEYQNSMFSSGYKRNDDGTYELENDPTIGTLLKMKKSAEQAEKNNRLKATNAGVFNALSLIGDMISAGVGGDVQKREKMDIAEKAYADTEAKKEALRNAEYNAEIWRRKDLQDSILKAQAARDKYIETRSEKVSKQHTPKITTTNTTNTSNRSQSSPEAPIAQEIEIPMKNGNFINYHVPYDKYVELVNDLASNLDTLIANNEELKRALIEQGVPITSNGVDRANLPTNLATILTSENVSRHYPIWAKNQMRGLFFDSLELAREFKDAGKEHKEYLVNEFYNNPNSDLYIYESEF